MTPVWERVGTLGSRLILAATVCAFLFADQAHAAGSGPGNTINWQKQDTANYVVSTINLVRSRNGEPAMSLLRREGATAFDVYADRSLPNLYYIVVERASEQPLATLIFRMGWPLPRGAVSNPANLAIRAAPPFLIRAAQRDPRELLGTFTSTP